MTLSNLSTAKAVVCGFALLSLAACASGPPRGYMAQSDLPTEHYAVHVIETPEVLALAVHAEGVSAHQQDALTEFVRQWRSAGGGSVVLKAPADFGEGDKANAMIYAVQAQLEGLGVPGDRIQLASYNAGAPHGPVVASFQKATAQGPDCRGDWDNLTSTNSNQPYQHFGCAITANFAAQVADPRDFVAPPALAAGDLTRREVVLGKYRDGKMTSSEKDKQADGAVSSAVAQ